MTYKQLAELIANMSPDQQNCTALMHDLHDDEYVEIGVAHTDDSNDVLDENHPVIVPV